MKKRIAFFFIMIMVLCSSCDSRRMTFEDISKRNEERNIENNQWDDFVDSLGKLADTNSTLALSVLKKTMNAKSLTGRQFAELRCIRGEIYYDIDSFQNAINEFSIALQSMNFSSPKELAARAGAYIKLEHFDSAFQDLMYASEINYDYLWNLGNCYEVIENRDSAISCYQRLYSHDTSYYKFCHDRIVELNSNAKLYTELHYRDRKKPGRIVLHFVDNPLLK